AKHIEYMKCVKSQIPRQAKRGQDTKIPQSGGPLKKVGDEAVHKDLGDRMEMAATTASSLDAGQGSSNINKTISMPHDSPLPRDRCEALETDLRKTKKVYGDDFTRLIKKVKKFEKTVKTSQARRRARVVISDDEEELEDPSKQGRREAHTQQDQLEDHLRVLSAAKVLAYAARKRREVINVQSYTRRRRAVSTDSGEISIAEESVSTAGASMPVSTAAERQRMAQVHQATQGFTDAECDDVLARVAADEDFVQQLQAGEKCSEEDLPMKRVELVNQRKKFFSQQRAEAKRNKPMTPTQQKEYMSNYIKNQEGDSELEVQRLKRASQEVSKKTVKRQKIREASGSGEEHSIEKEKELSQEDLHQMMMVVPVEEVYVEALQVKYPIIDWEIYSEDTKRYWRIIRVGNHIEAYQTFDDMLKKFDKDDLDKLWGLVKERFSSIYPTDDKERTL
ncbi:hypothetical protein Tco_1117836, partial [Tanacetum coccineum]